MRPGRLLAVLHRLTFRAASQGKQSSGAAQSQLSQSSRQPPAASHQPASHLAKLRQTTMSKVTLFALLAATWYFGYHKHLGLFLVAMIGPFLYSLYKNQHRMLYQARAFPQYITPDDNPNSFKHPGEWGIPFETVYLETPDGLKIHAWLLKKPETDQHKTIIYFQGNAGSNFGASDTTNLGQIWG